MRRLSQDMIACLRRMDEEADTIRDGHVTGLNWYGGHARPELKRPQTEPEWTKRLAVMLGDSGWDARAEVAYPSLGRSRRNRCDLVVTLEGGQRAWIEIKGAWRTYWKRKGGMWFYKSYLFHPLVPGLDASKTHTVPRDLEKLATLTGSDAAWVGEVVVGFDEAIDPMDGDIARLEELAGLGVWEREFERWDDARRTGERVSVWTWWRAIG